jgi:acyl-homoserine lactone acylase PvdQ
MGFLRPMKQHTQQLQEFQPYSKKQFFLKVESQHRSYLETKQKWQNFSQSNIQFTIKAEEIKRV